MTLASGLLRQSIAAVVEDGGDQNKAPHGTGYWTQNLVQAEITTITSLLMKICTGFTLRYVTDINVTKTKTNIKHYTVSGN